MDGISHGMLGELESELSPKQKRYNKKLAWAEQKQTIGEVGSTFTIQGFDLNYAGVILGPSVKYKDGRVNSSLIQILSKSCNTKAVRKRYLLPYQMGQRRNLVKSCSGMK
ncbi:MAG: DNA/RNA helicase domain-containing protein [Ruminococcus sp.]